MPAGVKQGLPCIPALALALDMLLGDPPNQFHPVYWMGRFITAAQAWAPRKGRLAPLLYGGLIGVCGAAIVSLVGVLVERLFSRLPAPLGFLAEASVLKTTLSLRGLGRAGRSVQDALENADLPEARRLLAWHLVSRDTTALTPSQIAAAAVESLAENTSDGIIAPLFFYTLGGLPGALAYRFINTCDSMLGYHDASREWLGKIPARLDDVFNLIPARLTALFIMAAAVIKGRNLAQAFYILRRDAKTTESPNAGYPMSAMAGTLGIELEKTGHYRLGAGQQPARSGDIGHAIHLTRTAVMVGAAVFLVGSLILSRRRKQR